MKLNSAPTVTYMRRKSCVGMPVAWLIVSSRGVPLPLLGSKWHHSWSKPSGNDQKMNMENGIVIAKRPRKTFHWTVRPGPEGEVHLPNGAGSVVYVKDFLTSGEADALIESTRNARSWERSPITFFGKSVLQPRDTAFYGTKFYSYSDETRRPTGWNDDPPASNALHDLGQRIEKYLKLPTGWFNVILANRYHHGQDYMGWHADNEKSLGEEPIIASLSVGAERRFLIRPKPKSLTGGVDEKLEYTLAHGSLLVMKGKMQQLYQHSLPKVALSKCNNLRLNFTYRRVVDESDQSKYS